MNDLKKDAPRERYHHGDLRTQLIEATRQLIEQKGPDHFSVAEASRLAGVSSAAPYKHFKDKDDLVRAVALGGMRRQHDQLIEELDGLPPQSLDRISALGRVYIRFALSEPAVFRLMFGLSKDHNEDDALVQQGENMFGAVKAEVARYRGSDVIEEIDEKRAFQLWSFVHGLSFLLLDGKLTQMELPVSLDEMLDDIGRRVMQDV
ncbi:TetR/AcrR family transcriptional regulator [Nereida sp. MMG025]|uniref:TetR/AcrR family transcriptional regulator n=1 Tax=Nereida sp. MMG025 TaxID=2909981 RepID=UPI001F1F3A8D|nr:TetR/AcrR family transcriptional regulator [Nereida sp. MMG025]MCF6446066.1 TetR/AcrR family transcriptional regulator [Nereida sp. MMG025]